ncbi:hypothetical protein SKAU_G00050420 [Synaphobranchus kaupii]|uniref:Uncharacterized protein n=1 Tax=Synaphobranchus kaupii TaxID=118154 RepID=A0A9Q1J9Q8_SYNKA|nr:hypothetical protein SKAU_G00050420 [Synaphobranchus kaupii]
METHIPGNLPLPASSLSGTTVPAVLIPDRGSTGATATGETDSSVAGTRAYRRYQHSRETTPQVSWGPHPASPILEPGRMCMLGDDSGGALSCDSDSTQSDVRVTRSSAELLSRHKDDFPLGDPPPPPPSHSQQHHWTTVPLTALAELRVPGTTVQLLLPCGRSRDQRGHAAAALTRTLTPRSSPAARNGHRWRADDSASASRVYRRGTPAHRPQEASKCLTGRHRCWPSVR